MKKRLALLLVTTTLLLTGCQTATKTFGGSMTIELPKNTKLELITWKADSEIWYLTRPMRDDELPETHTYQEQSEWGVFEGTITIIESR